MCECVLREDGSGIIRDFYCRRSKIVSLNQRIVKLKMRIKSNLLLYHDYMKMECMYFKSTDSAFLFAYKLWVCLSLKVYCSLIKCLFDLLSSSCILWKQIVYICKLQCVFQTTNIYMYKLYAKWFYTLISPLSFQLVCFNWINVMLLEVLCTFRKPYRNTKRIGIYIFIFIYI